MVNRGRALLVNGKANSVPCHFEKGHSYSDHRLGMFFAGVLDPKEVETVMGIDMRRYLAITFHDSPFRVYLIIKKKRDASRAFERILDDNRCGGDLEILRTD